MNCRLAILAAAVFGAASAAQAADLGRPAPVAVDYVKVCDAYGAGFFYIPGTETCLKIGGFVRARFFVGGDNSTRERGIDLFDYKDNEESKNSKQRRWAYIPPTAGPFANVRDRYRDNFATATTASIQLDSRTATEFGLLRGFIDARLGYSSYSVDGAFTSAGIDKAYIQWGGLTVGYAESFFDFFTGSTLQTTFEPFWSDHSTNLLAYTFSFGNGVSATLSLEDSDIDVRQSGSFLDPISRRFRPGRDKPEDKGTFPINYYDPIYGGNRAPDVVANVNITQGWGSAQIMAAAHQAFDGSWGFNQDGSRFSANNGPFTGGDEWGYAVGAGLKVNTPMIGAGDYIALQGAYSKGAMKYLGLGTWDYLVESRRAPPRSGDAEALTGCNCSLRNSLELTEAWAISGGFSHNFTPSWAWNIDAGWASVDAAGDNDFDAFRVTSDIVWTPVSGLSITLEGEYQNVSWSNATKDAFRRASSNFRLGDANAWVGVLQVRRAF